MGAVMFGFAWPWLGILGLVPFLLMVLLPPARHSASLPVLRFPHLAILRASFGGFQAPIRKTSRFVLALILLLWLCLVAALMRPEIVDQITEVNDKGYDIMLAVDLSGSMRALDFSTQTQRIDRLDVAKAVVGDFVRERKSDRIGLVLFGDSAYQYAPLTRDTQSVAEMLGDTAISMAGDGTAIGDAIGVAVKALRERPEQSRMIILLTDGEDTASSIPPLQAAQLAKNYGIRIYTIGIGSQGRVPYPDEYGRIVMVRMALDEQLLGQIAEMTGGGFFKADSLNALQQVYAQIDRMEKTDGETRRYMVRTPLYRYPLAAALLLLALLVAVSMRQKAGGRFDAVE